MPYADLREYLAALETHGKLHHITTEVDKGWEISAVCRRVFQTIPPERRPALMFDRVRGGDIPVVAGILGASREVYALALETTVDDIGEKWARALSRPIAPVEVRTGPCKEVILRGEEVDLYSLPVPTWTVEHDPAPFFTSPFVVTKDPETGIRNMGTYRMQLKSLTTTGIGGFHPDGVQHFSIHMRKYRALGKKMPVAVIIGADPTIGYASVSRVPYSMDEFAVSGGLRGAPVEMVKCETVDLEVPATAEIVLEGFVDPTNFEWEGPFGEFPGYMGAAGRACVFQVQCITHRRRPIFQAFVSQMPPSESSCIRGIGREQTLLKHLRQVMDFPVRDVHYLESSGSSAFLAISIKKDHPTQPQEVMWAAWSLQPSYAKFLVVVDDDIDIRDPFSLNWALSFRVQPERDIRIQHNTIAISLDPSQAPPDVPDDDPSRLFSSKVGIDATRQFGFPPIALPPQEHMERVRTRWAEYGF